MEFERDDYYKILDVEENASQSEIASAYSDKSRKLDPLRVFICIRTEPDFIRILLRGQRQMPVFTKTK